MNDSGMEDEFVIEMIACQRRLYAYVLSVVFDRERAREIVQQVNLILLQKKSEFEMGTNFGAWACRVAFYEILADRRRRTRDRHLFDDETLALVATKAEAAAANADERVESLESCLQELSTEQRQLIRDRYSPGGSVNQLAEQARKSPAAISSLLYRIRTLLNACVERKLEGQVA